MAEVHHPNPHAIPALPAATIPVTNCDDSGAGSLRDALQNVAVDGDTVDLTGLSCSVISLTTGSILFFQNSITLQGPGTFSLYLSGGGGSSRVAPLLHDGTGTLTINDMTIEDGAKYFTDAQTTNARGGCIFSAGFVDMNDSEVKYCSAQNTGNTYGSLGGAVYAYSGISLSNTSILDSSATATNTFGKGGGVYTLGSLTIVDSFIEGNTASTYEGGASGRSGGIVKYSQISNNEAHGAGGIYILGNATIENSTISSNTADFGGGVWFNGTGATGPVTLLSSTVSGNNAVTGTVGGVQMYGAAGGRIANSTIAFNTTHDTAHLKYGAGLHDLATAVELESNIIAGNTNDSGSVLNDDVYGTTSASFNGANNLIVETSGQTAPPDTISADPLLNPLASNGGETLTHAIRSPFSPAINTGNNDAAVSFDQRGSGFPRVIGAGPDIGAFEFDLSDEIFFNGFDP